MTTVRWLMAQRRLELSLRAGADEYIMKPFDSEILQSKLEQAGLI